MLYHLPHNKFEKHLPLNFYITYERFAILQTTGQYETHIVTLCFKQNYLKLIFNINIYRLYCMCNATFFRWTLSAWAIHQQN